METVTFKSPVVKRATKIIEKPAAPVVKEKTFVIEKIKWAWPKTVKTPSVYRDDEMIRSATKEDALAATEFLLQKPQGLTYTITVLRDGEYFTYYRHSMPCLGGLTGYKDSNGDKFFFNPYFPRDIRVNFPDGEIIFIGICRKGIKTDMDNPYFRFVFSDESPWRAAFGSVDTVIFRNDYLIFTNTDADPTILYSLLRLGGIMGGVYSGVPKTAIHPKASILLNKSMQADPRRLAGQCPIITSVGNWKSGFGYTRGLCEHIFKTDLPVKALKDFAKFPTTGYPPNPPFTNKYFVGAMKEKFGVDVSNPNTVDTRVHDACVESWEFFKEEAGKLSFVLER